MAQSLMEEKCTGSFSYIFSAEWDYVSQKSFRQYARDRYSLSLSRRLDLIGAVRMLLKNNWVPYHCVEDIAVETSNKWSDTDGFTANGDATAFWLYNEFLYFTEKVRPLIYNVCNYEAGEENRFLNELKARKPACVILERKKQGDQPSRYELIRRKDGQLWLYCLPLTSIQLRLYASGVMNLSLCCNHEINAGENRILKRKMNPDFTCAEEAVWSETTADDIAWLRDAGRRLFWPFGCGKKEVVGQKGNGHVVAHPENAPVYSALKTGAETIVLCDYRALSGMKGAAITKPEHFDWTKDLICGSCVAQMRLKSDRDHLPKEDLLVIQYFNDDRMYLHNTVVSPTFDRLVKKGWIHRRDITNANKNEGSPAPSGVNNAPPDPREIWQGLQAWYAILAADADWCSASCQDADMLIQKCEETTDARWLDKGTFYGLYYNAITQLIEASPDSLSYLSQNMDWMYYQMFLLAIMQRSTIQRFYREASGAALSRSNRQASQLSDALKAKYVFFMNSMWFTEVTEQEQGCDFFEKLRENMGLNQDMELLKDAIEDLNSVTEKNLENAVNNALLPATFIGLALSAFDGLSHLFGQAAEAETGLNAFSVPFPWALTIISFGIGAGMWVYYLLKKR